MKPGRPSRTAVLVCMGRAVAHGARAEPAFSDPTAIELLPDDARVRVERFLAGEAPRGVRERIARVYLRRQAGVMVLRTVAIDDAVREAGAPQVVILGAGLDGRAWRMPELADAAVLEVDHPDSQREKRARVGRLEQHAREVRFVAVDFTRGSLDAALAAAGHDASALTTWIWEGVVMYLTEQQIDATLTVVARRSAPASRLVVSYHTLAPIVLAIAPVVRALGEPLRSWHSPAKMRSLLAARGLDVVRDEGFDAIAARLSPEITRTARFARHLHVVTAERSSRPCD